MEQMSGVIGRRARVTRFSYVLYAVTCARAPHTAHSFYWKWPLRRSTRSTAETGDHVGSETADAVIGNLKYTCLGADSLYKFIVYCAPSWLHLSEDLDDVYCQPYADVIAISSVTN